MSLTLQKMPKVAYAATNKTLTTSSGTDQIIDSYVLPANTISTSAIVRIYVLARAEVSTGGVSAISLYLNNTLVHTHGSATNMNFVFLDRWYRKFTDSKQVTMDNIGNISSSWVTPGFNASVSSNITISVQGSNASGLGSVTYTVRGWAVEIIQY